MRIALIHNYYGSAAPSGENQVFVAEEALLRSRGHEVAAYTRNSDDLRSRGLLGKVIGAAATPWNPFTVRALRRLYREVSPEVVHIHNSFPLVSPSALYASPSMAPRVMTLHNYRLFCAAGIPMRDGVVCTDCLDRRGVIPAVVHGCYRSSRLATLPLATGIALHRLIGTWQREVDIFIALTEFQRDLMIKAGLPAERVRVKPNFFPGNPRSVDFANRRERAVFVGRLSEEKGVRDLLLAWAQWGAGAPELAVVGDGPLRPELETLARERSVNVCFLGQLSSEEAERAIGTSRLLIVPSRCYEGFPMVLGEAFALGTPTAVSNLGPLPALVTPGRVGVTFAAGDPSDLLSVVASLWKDESQMEIMSDGARREYETKYSEDVNYAQLMGIYEEAIESRKRQMS